MAKRKKVNLQLEETKIENYRFLKKQIFNIDVNSMYSIINNDPISSPVHPFTQMRYIKTKFSWNELHYKNGPINIIIFVEDPSCKLQFEACIERIK